MKINKPTAVIVIASALFCVLVTGLFIGRNTARHFLYAEEIKNAPQAQSTVNQVDINTATVQELAALDGVSEELAQRIVDSREIRDGFTSTEQLLTVDGFPKKLLESLADVLTVK